MRKALNHINFRIYFLIILVLHLIVLLVHLQTQLASQMNQPVPAQGDQQMRVRVLRHFDIRKQIVESEDPNEKTAPKANARLSDKDRNFDRETRAKVVDSFQKGGKGDGVAKPRKSGSASKDLSLGALGGTIANNNPFERAARQYTKAQKSGGKIDGGGRGVSSTNDHIEGVPLGDLTHLNTVEYKFFGYYHRIKQKLEGFWGRSIQEKAESLAKQGRYLAEDQHVTALKIVMDAAGEIVEVVVLGSSGVKELDDAAIESFNAAGPFPNPPKDLIVNERVTIEWGFVVNS